MYAFGAASVKCAVCNTVTPVNQSTMTQLPHQQGPSNSNSGSGPSSSGPQKPQQTVVIVNPPTLDADGNEVGMDDSNNLLLYLCMYMCMVDRCDACSVLAYTLWEFVFTRKLVLSTANTPAALL